MTFVGKHLLLMVFTAVLFQACVSVNDTLYLQDTEVYGPIIQPPVTFMNRDSDKKFSLSPKIYFNGINRISGRVSGHSNVNSNGVFQVDTSYDEYGYMHFSQPNNTNKFEYAGDNLIWRTPDYTLGLDAEFYISPKFTITTGITISEVDRKNLPGYKIGVGFGGFSGDFGLRFDAGLIWQEYAYEASSIIVRETSQWFGESSEEVFFFDDKGTSINLNHYFSVNLHYGNPGALFYPFLSIAYSRQSILDFKPRDSMSSLLFGISYNTADQRGGANVSYIVLTPGTSFIVNKSIRFIAAAKFFWGNNIENVSQNSFVVPSLQLEFLL